MWTCKDERAYWSPKTDDQRLPTTLKSPKKRQATAAQCGYVSASSLHRAGHMLQVPPLCRGNGQTPPLACIDAMCDKFANRLYFWNPVTSWKPVYCLSPLILSLSDKKQWSTGPIKNQSAVYMFTELVQRVFTAVKFKITVLLWIK